MRQTFIDFIDFIRKQSIIGFAIGFILGRAVSDLVGSFVNDVINPLIGAGFSRFSDLSNLSLTLSGSEIKYGRFLSLIINFVILAGIIYFGFKKLGLEKLDKPKE